MGRLHLAVGMSLAISFWFSGTFDTDGEVRRPCRYPVFGRHSPKNGGCIACKPTGIRPLFDDWRLRHQYHFW